MPKYWMEEAEITRYLEFAAVGRLATCDAQGQPYITPLHYIFYEGDIYFHCAARGRKLDNIMNNSQVCFEVSHIEKTLIQENACSSATRYSSVLAFGEASLVEDVETQVLILNKIMEKYAAGQAYGAVTPERIKGCVVVRITISQTSGKKNIDP